MFWFFVMLNLVLAGGMGHPSNEPMPEDVNKYAQVVWSE